MLVITSYSIHYTKLYDLLAYSDHEIKALYLGHLDEFFGDSVNLQNECKLINEKGKQHRNSYLRAKTGESIPVTVCLSIQTYNGAEYLVMHARDITYEQEREVACVERKEKYQTFFETAVITSYSIHYTKLYDILLGDIEKVLKPEATFICSGIINTKSKMVLDALTEKGFEVLEMVEKGEWVAITAQKRGQ